MSGSAYGGVDRHQDLAGLGNDDHTQYGMNLSGTLAARPAASRNGRLYFATDTGSLYYDSGTAWTITVGSVNVQTGTAAYTPAYNGTTTYGGTASLGRVIGSGSVTFPTPYTTIHQVNAWTQGWYIGGDNDLFTGAVQVTSITATGFSWHYSQLMPTGNPVNGTSNLTWRATGLL